MHIPPLTICQGDLASALNIAEKTLQNKFQHYIDLGMPRPLPLPGRRVWQYEAIREWIRALAEKPPAALPAIPEKPAKRGPGRPRKLAAGGAA